MGRSRTLLIPILCLAALLRAGEEVAEPAWWPALRGGTLHADVVRVAGLEFTDVSGTPLVDGTGLHIPDLAGDCYGGRVAAVLRSPRNGRTELELDLTLLSLSRLIRGFAKSDLDLEGSVSGRLALSLTGNPNDPVHGAGRMRLTEGAVVHLPFLAELLLGDPIARRGQDSIEVDFRIAKRRVVLQRIRAENPSVTLTGRGVIDFRGRLDVVLEPATRSPLLGIVPGLGDLANWMLSQIVSRVGRFQLVGYYRNPEVIPRPIEGLLTLAPIDIAPRD